MHKTYAYMKKLLSLPPNLVEHFHKITNLSKEEYFCTSDPRGHRLGSGGGTAWLLHQAFLNEGCKEGFEDWLSQEKRILMHAGGQSRRVPAYAPAGKVLTPIPVFRWARGQRLSQNLLSLQMPLYEKIMAKAPQNLHTMIVNGDVLIRTTAPLQEIPNADVVCYGLWLGRDIAKDHGVFTARRETPQTLDFMVQKPSFEMLNKILEDHYFLTDIGVWLLSDKAVMALMKHSKAENDDFLEYDLYSEFGCALGENPSLKDDTLSGLRVAILPLDGGGFYHYGSSHEIISSTVALQNLVHDQREILQHSIKVQPSIFTQNSICQAKLTKDNPEVWIENSWVGETWHIASKNIITGIPENQWVIELHDEDCVDIIPIGEDAYCARVYGYYDKFQGEQQQEKRFPVTSDISTLGTFIQTALKERHGEKITDRPQAQQLLNAEDISDIANLERLEEQRRKFRAMNWPTLAENSEKSVFYQIDLNEAAKEFSNGNIPLPSSLKSTAPLMTQIHDRMFRSQVKHLQGDGHSAEAFSAEAFSLLGEGLITAAATRKQHPKMSVYPDQIVWGRSPVRIDVAGGWTDTPPYCLTEGGSVVNFAIELNGQPPLQTYVRVCKEPVMMMRSIDLGASETIKTYEELADFNHVGSPFSIPKAALALAGFLPEFSENHYSTLEEQLKDFGCGIEVTMLAAIPAGSGLGTSSILASTVLGAVSNFCGLAWDKNEICRRTLVLEQMLTTGGGWQDQFGGVLPGIKLLQTGAGLNQTPVPRWLPDSLFSDEMKTCHLLYYTGLTRTAKNLLAEIVKKMFLNDNSELALLADMRQHATNMYEAIQRDNFELYGHLVRQTWIQNQLIDRGTNPPEVERIIQLIDDYCLGYKLCGAGGGGYLYMVAKDAEAALRIHKTLDDNRRNANERFVEMSISKTGLQISRS